jgi:putative transposase
VPRRLRVHVPGGFYHVTLRGNHQSDIFRSDGDRRLLNVIVANAIEKFKSRLHAYCWMTNHVHLLVQVGTEPLARPMRKIAAEFARAMQIKLATTGHFFERRYHARLVDTDSYLLELVRYIHLNPVRAGIMGDASQFPWSSHHAYVGSRVEPWVTTDFVLQMFAANGASGIEAYRRFLSAEDALEWSPEPDPAPRQSTRDDFTSKALNSLPSRKGRGTLGELIDEACTRFGVDRDSLNTVVRDASLARVRAWIAHQALTRRIETLSGVARALARDESTLREAIKRYRVEME